MMKKNKTLLITLIILQMILATTVVLAAGTEFSVIVDQAGDMGQMASMAIVDGYPAIAYEDHDAYELKYVRALDAQGKTWGTPITIPLGGSGSRYLYYGKLELVVVNGNPAIAFYDYDGSDLYFVRATDAQGTSWGTPICADCNSNDRGYELSMAVVNGNPAITYQDYDNEDVYFVQATNASGTAWGTPVLVSNAYGEDIEIVIANGRPAIAYYNHDTYDVEYVLADDINGASWGTPLILDDTMGDYDELAMTIVNGNPAVAYYDYDNEIMYYIRATNADGTSWDSRVIVRENDEVDSYHDLIVIDGYPTIAYQRNSADQTDDDLALIQAADANGASWKEPRILLSDGDIGMYNTMVSLANGLGVATHDGADGDLYYFSYFGSVEPDTEPPTVVYGSNTIPSTGARLITGPTKITIEFSENITQESAESESNYLLLEAGVNGIFDTTACATGTEFSIIVDQAGDMGKMASMTIVDGNPAIAYEDHDEEELKYVRALDAQGKTWGTPITIPLGGSRYLYYGKLELVVVNGNPAIAFYDYGGENLYFVRATDAQGASWGTPICADCNSNERGSELSMAVVNGNPAIAYQDYDDEEVYFVQATNASGTAWGTPVLVSSAHGEDIEIVIANGRPAVAYYDHDNYDIEYVLADDINGTSWGTPLILDDTMGAYDELAMTIVNGNPAVAYYDYDNEIMYYIRATNANGTSWGTRVEVRADDHVDSDHELTVIDGYPTIAYRKYDDNSLALIQASDINGTSWKEPRILFSDGDIGMYNTMVSLENGLGVATHDGTDEDLYYFSYFGSVEPPAIGSVSDDDTKINVNTASYDDSNPFITTLTINDGIALPLGRYRLFVCGVTSIEDPAGNKLNGGTHDSQINFTVEDEATSLPKTGFAPGVLTRLPVQAENTNYTDLGSLWVEIPMLGTQSPIVGVDRYETTWDTTWLGDDVGYLNDTAYPTWPGNTVLTAHVYNYLGLPGPFHNIHHMNYGTRIIIHDRGMQYIYSVRSVQTVLPDDMSAIKSEELDWVTLITCRGYVEETDTYPLRTVVRAVLVEVIPE